VDDLEVLRVKVRFWTKRVPSAREQRDLWIAWMELSGYKTNGGWL
jgi:hypothetical protein